MFLLLCTGSCGNADIERKGCDAMDAFVEQIVSKKKGGKEIGIIVGSLVLLAALLFAGYLF